MKKILFNVMKNKVINLIRILGFGINELLITIPLSVATFDSIEWDDVDDSVYLHIFEKDDYDMVVSFDDLSEEDQLKVYQILAVIYN
jgi:hypothetical protein